MVSNSTESQTYGFLLCLTWGPVQDPGTQPGPFSLTRGPVQDPGTRSDSSIKNYRFDPRLNYLPNLSSQLSTVFENNQFQVCHFKFVKIYIFCILDTLFSRITKKWMNFSFVKSFKSAENQAIFILL